MTETKELKRIIKNKGLKYKYVAETLGLTYNGLRQKIENICEFKASEIRKMCEILNIGDPELIDRIFFAN